jgi:hypothetical protein
MIPATLVDSTGAASIYHILRPACRGTSPNGTVSNFGSNIPTTVDAFTARLHFFDTQAVILMCMAAGSQVGVQVVFTDKTRTDPGRHVSDPPIT